MKNKEKILILDGQTVQALPFYESLHKQGYFIIAFCDKIFSHGYSSRFIDKKVICPPNSGENNKFKEFFFKYIEKNKIDTIIPMNDYSASFLSKNKTQINQFSHSLIPDYDTFIKAYDKNKLMYICRELNLPHPKTCDLETTKIATAGDQIGYPAIIKPNITTGARGMKILYNKEELIDYYNQFKNIHGPFHLQQFIPQGGKQYKVQIFTDNKNIFFSTVIEKIRYYPTMGGSSCCNKTIENKNLVNICNQILNHLNWVGFADFDLIENPDDGSVNIMEINPRVPACVRSSIISGIDFAEIIVNYSLKKTIKSYNYSPDKYLRFFGMDLMWFLKSKKRFKTSPGWFKFFGSNVFYQDGSKKDPIPFLIGTIAGFLKILNPSFRKLKSGLN